MELLRKIGRVIARNRKCIAAFLLGAVTMFAALVIPLACSHAGKLLLLREVIAHYFVEEADTEKITDAAGRAMVDALGDRWSRYMSAEELKADNNSMKSQYVGVGITISFREDGTGIDILSVEKDGPAEKAGILPGDILIGADDVTVDNAELTEIRSAVAGEKGTKVLLTVLRDGEKLSFTVKRDAIRIVVSKWEMLENNVALIRVESFKSHCAEETIASVEAAIAQGAQALVFDVRYNPGGYTKEMVETLDHLLPEGVIFRTVTAGGREDCDYSDAACVELPMAVLVNGSSYSAAEFFAAALQEYDAAVIVGEQTTGKGYYQLTYPFPDGSGVALSSGRYFTPGGESLIGKGVTPDVVVETDDATAAQIYAKTIDPAEDPQILAAIEALKIGK